jgi:sigma-E factor negative regulatory protein RseA
MTDSRTPLDERISALMDGALRAQECPGVVRQVLADPEGARVWHAYHLVGDALRSPELVPAGDDHAFWERLSQKLAQATDKPHWVVAAATEAMVVDDATSISSERAIPIARPRARVAANASLWRWKLLAGAACSALVGVVVLGLWPQTSATNGIQLASQAAPEAEQALAAVEGSEGVMLRDPHLDQLIAAHQQVSGHSALQAPSGFLRNATYEGAER